MKILGALGGSAFHQRQKMSPEESQDEKKEESAGTLIKAPFPISEIRTLEIPEGMNCKSVLSSRYVYNAYSYVQKDLAIGKNPDGIRYLNCFLALEPGSVTAKEALLRFNSRVFLPDVLLGWLQTTFEENLAAIIAIGEFRDGRPAWNSSYLGQAALAGFRSTNDRRFLDSYIKYFDRLLMLRDSELGFHDDYHDMIMASWGSTNLDKKPSGKPKWIAHVTQFSAIMIPATGFARDIKTNPGLLGYLPWADKVLDFFEIAYRQFDVDRRLVEGTKEHWYWRPLLEKFEATNHVHLQGQALLNAYVATGNALYKDRIEDIIRVFKKGLVHHDDGSVSWRYSPYFQVDSASKKMNDVQYSEFSWKGAITVPFLFQAESDGLLKDKELLDAIATTIRSHIVGEGTYKASSHPFGANLETSVKNYPSISGYLYAAFRDPVIAENVVGIVSSQQENFPGGWFGHPLTGLAYALILQIKEQHLA